MNEIDGYTDTRRSALKNPLLSFINNALSILILIAPFSPAFVFVDFCVHWLVCYALNTLFYGTVPDEM